MSPMALSWLKVSRPEMKHCDRITMTKIVSVMATIISTRVKPERFVRMIGLELNPKIEYRNPKQIRISKKKIKSMRTIKIRNPNTEIRSKSEYRRRKETTSMSCT